MLTNGNRWLDLRQRQQRPSPSFCGGCLVLNKKLSTRRFYLSLQLPAVFQQACATNGIPGPHPPIPPPFIPEDLPGQLSSPMYTVVLPRVANCFVSLDPSLDQNGQAPHRLSSSPAPGPKECMRGVKVGTQATVPPNLPDNPQFEAQAIQATVLPGTILEK